MALGPIEVVVIAFPQSRFSGDILPELERLIENQIISVVDGLFVTKGATGDVMFAELTELDANPDAAFLGSLIRSETTALLSDEDVDHLADALDPGSSAAILVFEHTWAKPLRDAIVFSGGELVANFRVPGLAVEALLAEIAAGA